MIHQISDATPRGALIDIHAGILVDHHHIRVLSRWGAFTEYAVKLKRSDAALLTGQSLRDDATPYRLVFGWDAEDPDDDGPSFDIQRYHTPTRQWEPAFLSEVEERVWTASDSEPSSSKDISLAMMRRWLDQHLPIWATLIEIDRRLLQNQEMMKE